MPTTSFVVTSFALAGTVLLGCGAPTASVAAGSSAAPITLTEVAVSATTVASTAIEQVPVGPEETWPSAPSDLDDFVTKSWPKVFAAEQRLVADPERLGALVALLDSAASAPLEDTADLIYPGAKQSYGHGLVMSYPLDSIAWRAGWAIEEMTFERFGFSVAPFGPAPGSPPPDAVARAKAWFKEHPRPSRYVALREALASEDPGRASAAIQWIRYGTTPIAGFDRTHYERELLPLIQKAARSKDEGLRNVASLLLREDLAYAISRKKPKR